MSRQRYLFLSTVKIDLIQVKIHEIHADSGSNSGTFSGPVWASVLKIKFQDIEKLQY